jgi:DNA polymerase-4
VLHVDLDQFIAAVEVLRHPELRGRPVVVGGDGDPTKRGVVSTASYEAREHGVHSGLPLRTAARRLPDAVFLPVDRAAYEEVSDQVMAVLRESGAVVEVLGWDEAFLGVDTADPEGFGRRPSWTARWGSARTSCKPRSPPGSASRPGCSG